MSEMNRREFLLAGAATAAALSLPVLVARADDAAPHPTSAPGVFDVGPISGYAKDGVTKTWAAKNKGAFFVIRQEGKIYASSSLCTHKFCVLTPRDTEFHCRCHDSNFTLAGTVTDGPAKSSLARYAISKIDGDHLQVDVSKSFKEKDWDDPAASVAAS